MYGAVTNSHNDWQRSSETWGSGNPSKPTTTATAMSSTASGTNSTSKLRQTCDACQAIKTRCSRERPSCARCLTQNIPCHYSISRRIGRPRRLAQPTSPTSSSQIRRSKERIPKASQPSSESTHVAQPQNNFYSLDWTEVDIDADNDTIISDQTPPPSVVDQERSQASLTTTPSIARTQTMNVETSVFPPIHGVMSDLNDRDFFNSCFDNMELTKMRSSLSSSMTNNVRQQADPTSQQNLDDSDADKQSISLSRNFAQHIKPGQSTFPHVGYDEDMPGVSAWDFLNEFPPQAQHNTCRCLESALSITLSIRKGNMYPGGMDLTLDLEVQLREIVPVAIQCNVCKSRQGETLKLLSNAMADVVDLLQQLCNVEFADSTNISALSKQQLPTPSKPDRLEWGQPPYLNARFMPNSHQPISHERSGSDISGSSGAQDKLPSPKSIASEQNPVVMIPTSPSPEKGHWRILVGRHLLVGDDRKFVLIHLLRRRLFALSNVLESLIRAMQDLRIAIRREQSFVAFKDDALNTTSEMDTRRSMKTASKLYDIIDQLEGIRI
ncbi:AflR-like C6 transcription factor, putative [Talaromyces stipitatus ATCC 10500]|uniref:AflR-like C6 transcription factor, putative n=1 Tax=Talaromyces stipitatus (strain ATCC 10500 / CBS 375.48 / QM 6759 / NRRL 1006) TaxID=441959 RepID=B8MCL3_TALSN|nr:AflR-like C6 transcription factor, putative [Talaromyces stipitatus ATCC 10500]EED18829.1 AflR-like C6 transcription factor, putative [Talaromyces stipitatus ATCC 10500]